MSTEVTPDGMTPAETACAFRSAIDYLIVRGCERSESVRELRCAADQLDPPDTVESLRADVKFFRERFEAAIAERDLIAAERDETWRKILNLQAELDEREDVAAEREPRVWRAGDPEPGDVTVVRDTAPQWNCTWRKFPGNTWRCDEHGVDYSWESVADRGVTDED